jgi:hypothetical protein
LRAASRSFPMELPSANWTSAVGIGTFLLGVHERDRTFIRRDTETAQSMVDDVSID